MVGEAERGVAVSCSDVFTVDGADVGVRDFLEEESAFSDVAGDDGADFEAVDVPGFDAVRAGAFAVDCTHLYIYVRTLVALKPNGESCCEVEGDIAESEASGAKKPHAEVHATGHGKVRDVDIGSICNFNGTSSALDSGVDGSASFERLAGLDGDGTSADGS